MKNIFIAIGIFVFIIVLIAAINILSDYDRSEKNKCLMGIAIEKADNTLIEEKFRHFGVINIFIAWEDDFPEKILDIAKQNKKIIIITWEPYLHNDDKKNILPDIVAGKYDELLNRFAGKIKKYDYYVFIRWAHEMNGSWYPWAASPDIYKKAYLHIYNIFKRANCPKLKFIFSINNFDTGKKFENYYPGDDAVDVIGIDGYNWGNADKKIGWKSPWDVFASSYKRVIKLSKTKPVFITETSSTSSGGNKTKWIKDFFSVLRKKLKNIRAVVWFDIDKETDWSISRDTSVWNAYLKENKNPYFSADIECILNIFEENSKEGAYGKERDSAKDR
jgi:mannan endo-1,4-beta-mannosidase